MQRIIHLKPEDTLKIDEEITIKLLELTGGFARIQIESLGFFTVLRQTEQETPLPVIVRSGQ